LAKGKGPSVKAAGPKAIVFYQASLKVFPQNFMAANDLGVMLARNGNYKDACRMLEHSCSLNRQPTVLNNLAMVYERLGANDKARQALQQVSIAMQTQQSGRQQKLAGSGDQVLWVDENTFAGAKSPPAIAQGTPPNTVVNNNLVPRQTSPVLQPAPRISQMLSAQYWTGNATPSQTPAAVSRPMPAMQPATTGWLPNTSYDARR
jgi:tetratricopeptide (TPR) repeat protein